jgi:hypothetical protein
MNVRRGLIRLWMVFTITWILTVEGFAIVEWSNHGDGPWWNSSALVVEHPDRAYLVPVTGNPFANRPEAPSVDWTVIPICPEWMADPENHDQGICRLSRMRIAYEWTASALGAMWGSAGIAFGVPLAILVTGCVLWWVARGFRKT